ncbi:MAG: extracellular solute-binding protein [Thermoanaerobaculum sp.]
MGSPWRAWGFRNGLRTGVVVLFLTSTLACHNPESAPSLALLTSLSPADVEALQKELHALTASSGTARVQVRSVPPRVFEEVVEVFTPHAEGGGWDLAVVPTTWLSRLEKRQAILEVPVHHVQKLSQAVSPLALLATSTQGKTLGYPLSVDVPALFVNPRFFPQLPTSLMALVSSPLPPGVLPLGLDLRSPSKVFPLLTRGNGTPSNPDLTEVIQALKELLASLGSAAPLSLHLWTVPFAESVQAQLFVEGKLAAFVGGPKAAALMEAVKAPYVVVPVPPLCEGCQAPKPWAQVTAVVVNSLCPFPDLAQKLALELALPDRNVRLNLAINTLPVLGGGEGSQILAQRPSLFGFQRALDTATVMTLDESSPTWQQWELALGHLTEEQPEVKAVNVGVTP